MLLLAEVDVVVIAWLMRVCGRKLRNSMRLLEDVLAVVSVVNTVEDGDKDELEYEDVEMEVDLDLDERKEEDGEEVEEVEEEGLF